MNLRKYGKKSLRRKLIQLFLLLLLVATLLIGFFSYAFARSALNDKGRVILKNSVLQAILLINSEQEKVASGIKTQAEAKEAVKTKLLGPLNSDGTRSLHNNIDLGANGYILAYSKDGYEVMHPNLEGQYVWNALDKSDKNRYIVQEQISAAVAGGGYVNYAWSYPHSDQIGEKISYSTFEPDWGWIVVATSYNSDFSSDAMYILFFILTIMFFVMCLLVLVFVHYIKRFTNPLVSISERLDKVSKGEYQKLSVGKYNDEITFLVQGYNNMIQSLQDAEVNIYDKNQQLSYLAYHDELTGLSNRYGIKNFVNDEENSTCEIGHLVLMDVSRLKIINATLGFVQGDLVLKFIGEFFSDARFKDIIIARTSSNEFALWITGLKMDEVVTLIQQIRHDLKIHIAKSCNNQNIDMHMAASTCTCDIRAFDTLYDEAAIAMKAAKEAKDYLIYFYEINMRKSMEEELKMREDLLSALRNREIVPYYQGKMDYHINEFVGVEALARWHSKELGFVPPSTFISALTQHKLIHEFTDYFIPIVLGDYPKILSKYGPDVSVAINIPPSYFLQENFIEKIKNALATYKTPPNKLILEITEDVLIDDYLKITKIIEQLHELKVQISIDDFGTGYSSLNYLVNMNFDEMKIDKSFIDQIGTDHKAFELFKILCNISEIYDYNLVAEGVETEDQLELIKTTSLNVIQGYLFSKPEPLG